MKRLLNALLCVFIIGPMAILLAGIVGTLEIFGIKL